MAYGRISGCCSPEHEQKQHTTFKDEHLRSEQLAGLHFVTHLTVLLWMLILDIPTVFRCCEFVEANAAWPAARSSI